MQLLKSEWTPCPLYSYIDEEEKVEKICEEVAANVLQINFLSTNFEDSDAFIYLNLSKI